MDRKQLFIDWVSANKLKNITPADFANLLERVFVSYCGKNIWDIENPDEYNAIRKKLTSNRKFKKAEKKLYKSLVAGAKLYYKFLVINEAAHNATMDNTPEVEVEQTLICGTPLEYPQEQNSIKAFFDNDKLSDIFYRLFVYANETNNMLELDVRSAIIGVKLAGERLRFYSDKEGNIKFVGIKKFANINKDSIQNLYRDIDDVNFFFETYQDKYLNTDDKIEGYIYHSRFGFGKIIEKNGIKIKVKFDDIDDEKVIQTDHHTCTEISEEEYEHKKYRVCAKEKSECETSSDKQSSFKRVGWDKYETVLLIEAFWKIENKAGNRAEILTELSKTLRQKAKNQGQEIDDKFRNYNGMAIQLSNLAASFFPNRASMHKTAIFEEIADLYKTDRVEFNKLLAEAHKVADDSIKIEPKTNSACKIDFNNSLNLSFTQPESVVYFGERKNEFGSWTDCYKYIMRCLYGDFPHIISALAKDSSYSLISNEAGLLRRPVRIVDNIFAEGNRSATDLMKHIKVMLDKCGVNYENLTINFSKKNGSSIQNPERSTPTYAVEIDEADFYSYVKEEYEENHKNDGKAYRASKHAQQCVDFIREINRLLSVNVFQITTKEEIQRVLIALPKLPIDEDKRKWFSYVIKRYYRFLDSKNGAGEENAVKRIEEPMQEKLDVSDYYSVIKSLFPDGYAFTNPLRKKRFIKGYAEIIGKEFSDVDFMYDRKIRQVGFISEEKVYLPSMVADEIKEEIQVFIDSSLESSPAIYYSAIYQVFNEKLSSAFSEDMLKKYIEFEFENVYSFADMFVATKGKQVDLKQVLIEAFLNCGCPLSMEELYNKLPNISRDAIDVTIKDRDFVVNAKGKSYFYKEIFVIDDAELQAIRTFIARKIQEKETVSGAELYGFINDELPSLIESNPEVTDLGFKNVLKLKLANDFNFRGDIISAVGQDLDVRTLYKNFCKQREKFTLSELEEFRDSITQNYIDWDGVFSQSVRVNEKTFIRRDFINFDVQKIDDAIGSYCVNDYIGFNDIINFTEFPPIGYAWNNYVLESYLFVNSSKFKLVHASFNGDKPVGGIVKSNSNIKNFNDLLTKIIKNGKLFDREKAFNFLLENEFIRTRKVKNIDSLIELAKREG